LDIYVGQLGRPNQSDIPASHRAHQGTLSKHCMEAKWQQALLNVQDGH